MLIKNSRIRVLPEEAFQSEKYDQYSSDQLLSKLNGINQELTKYSHINKKLLNNSIYLIDKRKI